MVWLSWLLRRGSGEDGGGRGEEEGEEGWGVHREGRRVDADVEDARSESRSTSGR